MVELSGSSRGAHRLDAVFAAVADPTRRAMLETLSAGRATVGELAAPFPISLAAASKHIQVLVRAGLVKKTVEGRTHRCALDARPLRAGFDWIRRYEDWWNARLDVLDALLREEDAGTAKGGGAKRVGRPARRPTAERAGGRRAPPSRAVTKRRKP